MAARVLLALVAVTLAGLLGDRLADHRACAGARNTLFTAALGGGDAGAVRDDVATVRGRCDDAEALVAAAGALLTLGDRPAALALAREATREAPESFSAWRAVARLAAGAEARRAVARIRVLNPRWTPPPPASAAATPPPSAPPAGAAGP